MATKPGVLLLVMDILRSDHGGGELSGYEFSHLIGDPSPEVSSSLHAVSVEGVSYLDRVEVRHVHQFSVGWRWLISSLERYPTPPFLLTDDSSYRLIYHGSVEIFPTNNVADLVRGECHFSEKFDIPVMSSSWFGGLRVVALDTTHARLWAFSNSDLHLRSRTDGLVMADEGEEFGSVEIPSNQTSLVAPTST